MNRTEERILSLDIIRIIAILMVIYNHRGCYWWVPSEDVISIRLLWLSFWGLVCKMGAPLFFSISGILLLNRDESIEYIARHRIARMLFIMLILSLINSIEDFSVYNVYIFFCTKLNWYLYAYLLFLIMLPYLRKLNKCTIQEMILFFSISGIMYALSGQVFVTCFNPLHSLMDSQSIFYGSGTHGGWLLVYPISGFFIYNIIENSNTFVEKIVILCGLISVILGILFYVIDLKENGAANYELIRQGFIYYPTLALIIAFVEFGKRNKAKISSFPINFKKMVEKISSMTFGIFLLETCTNVKELWKPIVVNLTSVLRLSFYNSCLVDVFIAFFFYLLIVIFLKKVPLIRKLL